MVRRKFYINGKPSSDFGIYAASDTYLNAPAVGYDSFSVPKVNGLFISEKDRLSNVTRRFSCFAPDGIKAACEALFQYLYSIDGYFVLQSDYDPGHYCYAYFEEGVEVTPFRTYAGSFDLYFSCMPQKYMARGIGKEKSKNLINMDDLVGHMAYYDIVDDKLCLMFFPGQNQYSNTTPVRVGEGGQFTFTADKAGTWTSVSGVVNLGKTPYGNASGGSFTQSALTWPVSLNTGTGIPYSLGIKVSSNTAVGFANMMLVKGSEVLPYEPYESMPPSEKWVYSINQSGIPIKPYFALTNVQKAIDTGVLPNRYVWFVHNNNLYGYFNATEQSVYFVNFNTVDTTIIDDTNSFGLVALDTGSNGLTLSEAFDGSIYYGQAPSESDRVDAVFTDISNEDAVGGDVLFWITLSVSPQQTETLSIMVNDALIYVNLTDIVDSASYVTMKINSKSYNAEYLVATGTSDPNDEYKSLNDRTTIYGDISLKSENRIIYYTESVVVSALAEVEWWTV